MAFESPAIVKASERVLLEIEKAVRGFPRYHKYACGADLRCDARQVAKCAERAWRDHQRRALWVGRLVFAVDDLKRDLQLSLRIQAFGSFREFEALARLVADLGRQCGGWQKQQSKRQNPGAQTGASERPQILSTRAASVEANP